MSRISEYMDEMLKIYGYKVEVTKRNFVFGEIKFKGMVIL